MVNVQELPFNSNEYSVAHPALSDEKPCILHQTCQVPRAYQIF
jgi:hypothetical protein